MKNSSRFARPSFEIPIYRIPECEVRGFGIQQFQGLNINYSGEVRSGFPPHRHENFEVFWIYAGQADIMIEGRLLTLQAPGLFLIQPGEVHHFRRTTDLSGMLVQFSPTFIAALDAVLPEPISPMFWRPRGLPVLALAADEAEKMAGIFTALHEEAITPGSQREVGLRGHLLLLFSRARLYYERRSTVVEMSAAESLLTRRFRAAVAISCPPLTRVKEFADRLEVSRSCLHRTVMDETGRSPSEWIHERLLVEAKRRLLHTEAGLAMIASDLGFSDASYFGRFFRRHTRVSPSRFRHERA